MRKVFIILLLALLSTNLWSQRERNYIYLFDCTKSMEGYGGTPNIWENTKQYLREDIQRLQDNDHVTIIPFQDDIKDIFSINPTRANWNRIENSFDNYINNITHTNICDAWDRGLSYIDTNKDNYFIILTDGNDNVKGTSQLCDRIRRWCGQNRNSYAFYVMLTPNANNPDLRDAIGECNTISLIDANGEHVRPFGRIDPTSFEVNTNELPKTLSMSLSTSGSFNPNIRCSDPLFDLSLLNYDPLRSIIKFQIIAKDDLQSVRQRLNNHRTYVFNGQFVEESINVTNPDIEITINNVPEYLMEIDCLPENFLGKSSYYQGFLFHKEKNIQSLSIPINYKYNKEAKTSNSISYFKVIDNNNINDFKISINGNFVEDNTFALNPNENHAVIGVTFNKNAKEGKRYLSVQCINYNNIDRINNSIPEDFEWVLRMKFNLVWNPLKKILFWLFVIIFIGLFLAAILLRVSSPKIKFNVNIISPINKAVVRKNEARKVVLTSNMKLHEKVFDRIFKGKTKYVYDEFWKDTIELTSASKGVRISKSNHYECFPHGGVLKPNSENDGDYELLDIEDNASITLRIN